jgi:hypothetical protein
MISEIGKTLEGDRTMEQSQGKQAASNVDPAKKHIGACHCRAVRFEVVIDLSTGGSRCNCSICTKIGSTTGIVKPSAFTLLAGEESLGQYEWGAKISRRFFCAKCGVHCFGRGHLAEIGGDYVSVNLNTLEDVELAELKVIYWDGRHNNWQEGPRSTPWPLSSHAHS